MSAVRQGRGVVSLLALLMLACAGVSTPEPGGVGHCTASEAVFFSCPIEGGALSVCGSSGQLQYRSGVLGSPDVLQPEDSDPAAFYAEVRDYPQSTAQVLAISRGGHTYEVHDEVSGGGGDMGPDASGGSWQGVLVLRDGSSEPERVVCQSAAVVDWVGLRTHLNGAGW